MTDWTALERIAQDSLRRGLTQMALHPSNFLALLAELREAQTVADTYVAITDAVRAALGEDYEMAPLVQGVSQVRSRAEQAEAEVARLTAQVRDYRDAVTQRDEIITERKDRVGELEAQVSALQGEVQTWREGYHETVRQRNAAQIEVARLTSQADAILALIGIESDAHAQEAVERTKRAWDARVASLTAQVQEARAQSAQHFAQVQTLCGARLKLENENERLQAQVTALEDRLQTEVRAHIAIAVETLNTGLVPKGTAGTVDAVRAVCAAAAALDEAVTEALKDRDYFSEQLDVTEKQRDGNEQAYAAWRTLAEKLQGELAEVKRVLDTDSRGVLIPDELTVLEKVQLVRRAEDEAWSQLEAAREALRRKQDECERRERDDINRVSTAESMNGRHW